MKTTDKMERELVQTEGNNMNDFKDPTFSAIENRIHAAKLERSAALGEAIGDALVRAWFALRRLLGTVAGHATALKARNNASQHLPSQRRIPAAH